jgi:hypothetical protein
MTANAVSLAAFWVHRSLVCGLSLNALSARSLNTKPLAAPGQLGFSSPGQCQLCILRVDAEWMLKAWRA